MFAINIENLKKTKILYVVYSKFGHEKKYFKKKNQLKLQKFLV